MSGGRSFGGCSTSARRARYGAGVGVVLSGEGPETRRGAKPEDIGAGVVRGLGTASRGKGMCKRP